MNSLQAAQDGYDLVCKAHKALAEIRDTLMHMHQQYAEFTDGRVEMMEYIRQIDVRLDLVCYDLHDHSGFLDEVITLMQDMAAQRDQAIADRDRLLSTLQNALNAAK
jgi:hypothetical protein